MATTKRRKTAAKNATKSAKSGTKTKRSGVHKIPATKTSATRVPFALPIGVTLELTPTEISSLANYGLSCMKWGQATKPTGGNAMLRTKSTPRTSRAKTAKKDMGTPEVTAGT